MTFARLREQLDRYDAYALDQRREPSVRVPKSWTMDIPPEKFYLCSLSEPEGIQGAVRGMDVVVHLAADPDGESWESLLNNNLIATYHVFEACRLARVPRIVAASSITVSDGYQGREPYKAMMERRLDDIPTDVPMITPEVPAEPRGLYAATKVWTESLARVYAHRHDISCLCIRIGQVERDRPRPPQGADIYVSQRDTVQIIERCVNAPADLRFEIYYGMSNNDHRWVDIEHARQSVGYVPQDRAEDNHDYDA